MKKETGGQAFPSQKGFSFETGSAKQTEIKTIPGMTLRDHFAGLAMTSVISPTNLVANCASDNYFDIIAEECYRYADAMLREHSK